jgi:FAD binding domain
LLLIEISHVTYPRANSRKITQNCREPISTSNPSIINMGSLPVALESKPLGSYPESGIDVLIVGTGLAGLTAAIECTRKGHNVRVLERNATINTAGQLQLVVKMTLRDPNWRRGHVLHGTERYQVHETLA